MDLPSGIFNQSYAEDMAIVRTRAQWLILLVFLAFLFSSPLYFSDRIITTMTIMGITIISVHGLNILTGYCGQLSIGHVAFMAVGGYTSAVLCARLGWSFWAAFPCAAIMAGMMGLLFGLPSLRVKGFYLIMATIAAHFIIIWVILQLRSITGGADGMSVPRIAIGSFVFKSKSSYFYLVMTLTCLATFAAINIVRTRAGRAFIAIRDNEVAAEVMGVNLWIYKLLAFFIGCVFAGVAGSLLVHYYAFASPTQFPFMDSVWFLGMLIVGGMGSTTGAILGTVSLRILDELVTIVGPILSTIVAAQAAASLGLIMRGLILILFLIFEPRGLAHQWEKIKAYFKLWPFSY
jgi:branched-chain amino acid transport system permease protein